MLSKLSYLFEVQEPIHIDVWAPIIEYLELLGATCIISHTGEEKADVGFYCSDKPRPGNQDFRVITINGLDQDHVVRPDYKKFFLAENWNQFDMGFLPGGNWSRGYARIWSKFDITPRYGVYSLGWPKSDPVIISGDYSKKSHAKKIRKILYAPQIEDGVKQLQVSEAAAELGVELVIKHWETEAYIEIYPWLITEELLKEISKANKDVLRRYPKLVTIADPEINFMTLLEDVDLLITDQSSTLYDALFACVPTLVIDDWKHACGICPGPQPSPDALYVTSSNRIGQAIDTISQEYQKAIDLATTKRQYLFDNLGNSSELLVKKVLQVKNKKSSIISEKLNIFSYLPELNQVCPKIIK